MSFPEVNTHLACLQVWWLPKDQRQWIHQAHPDFILTTKTEDTPFDKLKAEHIQKINDDWSIPLATFREYQNANLSINMFFVESSFMYSYAWCIGIDTVTTSNCRYLSTVDQNPFLQVSPTCRSRLQPCETCWLVRSAGSGRRTRRCLGVHTLAASRCCFSKYSCCKYS